MTVSSGDYEALLQDPAEKHSIEQENVGSLHRQERWPIRNWTSKFHPTLTSFLGLSLLVNLFFTLYTISEATSQSGRSYYGKSDTQVN